MIIRSTSLMVVDVKCYAVLIIITISDKKLIVRMDVTISMYKQGKNTSTGSHSKWGKRSSNFRHLLVTTEHTSAVWSIYASAYETLQSVTR